MVVTNGSTPTLFYLGIESEFLDVDSFCSEPGFAGFLIFDEKSSADSPDFMNDGSLDLSLDHFGQIQTRSLQRGRNHTLDPLRD